ncbi:MAG: c-type cytochrome domain-containing protein [candidate division WOR-3 bacterium]
MVNIILTYNPHQASFFSPIFLDIMNYCGQNLPVKHQPLLVLMGLLSLAFLSCPTRPKGTPGFSPESETETVKAPPSATVAIKEVSFRHDVLPLLRELAGDCHTAEDMAGNYALDSYEAIMASGTDSIPNVLPGKPDSSLLYLYLLKGHPFGKRPDSAKLEVIRNWILQGAKNN